MSAYYNEHDPKAAAILRHFIADGLVAPGDVDERSIEDVSPAELMGYTQWHFFAGGGFWSAAARAAGWPDDRLVITGSCPCQPFSAAGKGLGAKDERHLWPAFYRIICGLPKCPIFGEQVAGRPVIGPVQKMRPAQAQERFPASQSRRGATYLSALRKRAGPSAEIMDLFCQKDIHETATHHSTGILFDRRREAESTARLDPFRFRLARRSEPHRQRSVRGDGIGFKFDDASRVECSLFGSDRPEGRLHDGKHPGSALFPKHNDEQLGNSPDYRGGGSVEGEGYCINESIGTACRKDQQCSSPAWLDLVFDDLESAHYTCGAVSFPACSVGSPHIRQRLYWMAYPTDGRRESWPCNESRGVDAGMEQAQSKSKSLHDGGGALRMDLPESFGREPSGLGYAAGAGSLPGAHRKVHCLKESSRARDAESQRSGPSSDYRRPGPTNGFWRAADWLRCRDERWRPAEPGSFVLAHGYPGRVPFLRLAGNSICLPQAATFIESGIATLKELGKWNKPEAA